MSPEFMESFEKTAGVVTNFARSGANKFISKARPAKLTSGADFAKNIASKRKGSSLTNRPEVIAQIKKMRAAGITDDQMKQVVQKKVSDNTLDYSKFKVKNY